jgi:hypothetical protein
MTTTTKSQRDRYMRQEITFAEYYGQLVELLGEDELRGMLPDTRRGERTPADWRELLEADKHLNNVPLGRWDAMHGLVLLLVRRCDADKRVAITGSLGWSLSDSVCVLKTTARRFAAV